MNQYKIQIPRADIAEIYKILLVCNKIKIHFRNYWLFYLFSSFGLIMGVFYFIYQHPRYYHFEFLDKIIFGLSIFSIINYFWVGLVVLTLMISSFLFCRSQISLKERLKWEEKIKKANEEIDRMNAFYVRLINTVPVSILTLDKNGVVISANPYFTELSGRKAEEKIGKSIFNFSFVKQSEELYKKYEDLLKHGKRFQYFNHPCYLDRNVKYLNLYAVPLKDKNGNVDGAISIAQDNTEIFLALEEIKSRVQQLYLINQISRAINSSLNLQETLWLILRNAVKLTNATSAAILLLEGKDELVVKDAYNMPPGWQKVKIKIGEGICGHAALIRKPYFSNNVKFDPYYIATPEKENVRSELAVPIIFEGKVIGVIKVDSDQLNRFTNDDIELLTILANNASIAITNSKLYEEIINLNKTLEQKVAERTEELKIANQKLEKAIELKSQFIADASHDLRTPLTVIKGNLDLALRDPKITKEEIIETLKLIDEEVNAMSGILADLMILTHAGAGKLHLNKSKINLDNLIKTVAQSMEILAKKRNIKIEIKELNGATVFVDESKFLKLLVNLVSNAIKYGKENGWVYLRTTQDEKEMQIKVADNGIGIPEDELPYIFERFYRVDKVRSRDSMGGSGLGLAICKSIAEAHGGRITVTSKLGEGSEFVVHLPKASSCIEDEIH